MDFNVASIVAMYINWACIQYVTHACMHAMN